MFTWLLKLHQHKKQKSPPTYADLLAEAMKREKETGEEYCTTCAMGMEFPSSLTIYHSKRFMGGAYYCEGAGQTCASCAKKEQEKAWLREQEQQQRKR